MSDITFLGTGNFEALGRYWNSFVLDSSVLVEPSPTALPHLRRCGFRVDEIEVVVISHFHADHVFGWPFFLLDAALKGAGRTLHVVGPPGVGRYLEEMNELGGVRIVQELAEAQLDLRFVEVDGTWQQAGPLRLRAVEVVHVPHLRCFGYLFERGNKVIGYSGDTTPCAGLTELAEKSDVLVLECNGSHPGDVFPPTHMDEAAVAVLRAQYPDLPLVLTHLGGGVDASHLDGVVVPDDFDRLTV